MNNMTDKYSSTDEILRNLSEDMDEHELKADELNRISGGGLDDKQKTVLYNICVRGAVALGKSQSEAERFCSEKYRDL